MSENLPTDSSGWFTSGYMSAVVTILIGIEDMPVTLIVKPYKRFAKATFRLCALFSFLVFISFTPLFTIFLFAVYVVIIYLTNIFMNWCVKFGYKKIILIIIFAVLYFFCFMAGTNLRHFAAHLCFGF